MDERPIIFSLEMVAANIAGNKRQTRRLLKGVPEGAADELVQIMVSGHHGIHGHIICPYGKPGDLLWVRENWGVELKHNLTSIKDIPSEINVFYQADGFPNYVTKTRPSIHMPKSHARMWLRIDKIKVERLEDISEDDAIKEGIEQEYSAEPPVIRWKNYFNKPTSYFNGRETTFRNPATSFLSLFAKIHGRDKLDENPWLWVVEYTIISITGTTGIPRDIFLNRYSPRM